MSQTTQILQHLKAEPLTALQALNKFGCNRLAARINDLRNSGHTIHTETVHLDSNKRIARYHLVKGAK